MILETVNENLCVNKLMASKKDIIMVEGEMIVPDAKPDILSTICTSGVICVIWGSAPFRFYHPHSLQVR